MQALSLQISLKYLPTIIFTGEIMAEIYDVIVLGGGIVGASTAYSLVQQGQNVLLIDQFEPGHTQGSSHGDGRVVRFNYTESIYVEMALLAYEAWAKLSDKVGKTLVQETGLLEYGVQGDEAIAVTESILKQYDIEYETLTSDEANRRFPQYYFEPNSDIIFQPRGAVAFATPSVKALWYLIKAEGGHTQTGKRIASIDAQVDLVRITSTDGEVFTAKQLVLTGGSWTKMLAQELDLELPLTVTQEVLAYFAPKDDRVNHHVGTMPVMLDHHKLPNSEASFYCLPIVDIQGVKAGWHHAGYEINPDDERRIPDEVISALRGWIERSFPHLDNEPIETLTCLYTNTPDYHFILDKHPQHANVIIGTGFSGHGFKFGPVLGDMLANLVLGKDSPIALDAFSIARFDNPDLLDKRLGA